MSTLTLSRTSSTYRQPLQARVKFTSLDGLDTYYTWSPMESVRDINIIYLDAERAINETGSFNIIVEDSSNLLNDDQMRNARVTIEFGKTTAALKPFFIGYADIFDDRRPRSFYQEYLCSGPSTKIRAAELMLLFRKAADDPTNPNYGVANLVKDSITDRKWRPLNREDIEEVTGWLVDLVSDGGGIADEANAIIYPVINEVFTTEWDWLERMSALSGASWDLDYDDDFNEVLTFKYPTTQHTGVTIKSSDLAAVNDNVNNTSYLWDNFSVEDNASTDANVATRLYTTTIIDQKVISSQNSNQGSTTLTSRAIAQQVKILNDQRRITGLLFILSKVGVPESPKNRVNGDIVMDLGDDTPRGQTLATFSIPLDDIKTTPTSIFVNDIDVKVRFLQGENKIWLRLFQRSGLDGDPNVDAANVIRWHHNGAGATTQAAYSATSTNNGGDYKLKDTMTWASSNQGPTYTYSIFSNIRRLQARSNPTQAGIIRLKEAFVDTSFISDFQTNNIFLSRALSQRSKSRRSVQDIRVTIPNDFLFKPYNWVAFNDSLSNTFQDLQIQRARYVISALPGDYPIGALYCNLTLGGSFNPLIGTCSCG